MILDDRLKPYVDLAADVVIRNSRVFLQVNGADQAVEEIPSPDVVKTVVSLLNNGVRRWQLFNKSSVENLSILFFSGKDDAVVVGDWMMNSWMEFSSRAFADPSEAVDLMKEIYAHHFAVLDERSAIPQNWLKELDDDRQLSPEIAGNPWVLLVYLITLQPSSFIGELTRGRLNDRSK